MNKYVGINFKNAIIKGEKGFSNNTFIVLEDLIARGINEDLYILVNGKYVMITNEKKVIDWIKDSDDKKIYDSEHNIIELNDLQYDDYVKIYNRATDEVIKFIVEKYVTSNGNRCNYFLCDKTSDLENKTFCEYYNRNTQQFVYTERVFGLDKVIEDEELRNKVSEYFAHIQLEEGDEEE